MADETARSLFEQAIQREIEERMDDLTLEEIPSHAFSERFKKKIRVLMRTQERPEVTRIFFAGTKRAAVAALVAAVLAMTTILSVSALREQFFSFVAEVFEKYTAIHFQRISPSPDDRFTDPEFTVSVPTYIPKGFTLVDCIVLDSVNLEYEDGLGGNLSFSKNYLSGIGMNLNTEGVKLVNIEINGCPGFYYSNLGMQVFIWYDEYYLYWISTTLPKYEAEKVAKSVK